MLTAPPVKNKQIDFAQGLVVNRWQKPKSILFLSAFLVCVPVFIEAPLVRNMPLLSLLLTLPLLFWSIHLLKSDKTELLGDLLLGFSFSWLAGAVYWGWFRWEPYAHIPIESICLPFVVFSLMHGRHKIGGLFYIGSLVGTIITDIYFYLTGLIPYWREVMTVREDLVPVVLHRALAEIQNPWALTCSIVLTSALIVLGLCPLRGQRIHWWGFSGAVLSTILVDGLFWAVAFFV
jgi:hypothetical protein